VHITVVLLQENPKFEIYNQMNKRFRETSVTEILSSRIFLLETCKIMDSLQKFDFNISFRSDSDKLVPYDNNNQ